MAPHSKLVGWLLLGASCLLASGCDRSNRSSSSGSGGAPSVSAAGKGAGHIVAPQPLSPFIVVDQFGYRPAAEKIAVLRTPVTGFDKGKSYSPGAKYAVFDARSGAKVFEAAPRAWNGGATDASSGDKAWWIDFSSVTVPSDYFVLDEAADVRSPVFRIGDDVYDDVLTQSTRMYYYQRDGAAKEARYAGPAWADGVAHPQDTSCGLYSDGSGVRDLHGGWFDAGDQNRYTTRAATDVIELLRAYVERPTAFGDATNIPESGNGVPDLLDEVKWELDWLARMQNADGSVLSIVGHQGASPPSADKSPCKYGPASTAATLAAAATFAFASKIYGAVPSANTTYAGFAADLARRAQGAWTWAVANPGITFASAGKLGGGEQELDDGARLQKKVQAAVFLFALTGGATYQSFVDANYQGLLSSFDPFHMEQLDTALEYTRAAGATASVKTAILAAFKGSVEAPGYLGALTSNPDPYMAPLQTYTWGSNQVKSAQGSMFTDVVTFDVDPTANAGAMRAAERYVHYMHGVNPLQLVYLSNMPGVTRGVTRFFHTWFARGSRWDASELSKHGPPPGYLVGGPNPGYKWDACCPSGCGTFVNNGLCGAAILSPPGGQPSQKSYLDFNDGWPIDSWQVSEPDDGYQAKWVRLLSKFVK